MENHKIVDKDTGEVAWVSRACAVCGIVVVYDEPNGAPFRFSNSPNLRKYGGYSQTASTTSNSNGPTVTYEIPNKRYKRDNYVLINKRGSGCPDFQGCWNIPCGYLDYNETLRESVSREVFEECNIYIAPERWNFFNFEDSPYANKQNVTFRFITYFSKTEFEQIKKNSLEIAHETQGEENEVEDIQLLNLDDINSIEWAFNHKNLINEVKNHTNSCFNI